MALRDRKTLKETRILAYGAMETLRAASPSVPALVGYPEADILRMGVESRFEKLVVLNTVMDQPETPGHVANPDRQVLAGNVEACDEGETLNWNGSHSMNLRAATVSQLALV